MTPTRALLGGILALALAAADFAWKRHSGRRFG